MADEHNIRPLTDAEKAEIAKRDAEEFARNEARVAEENRTRIIAASAAGLSAAIQAQVDFLVGDPEAKKALLKEVISNCNTKLSLIR